MNEVGVPATVSLGRWRRIQSEPELIPLTDMPEASQTEIHDMDVDVAVIGTIDEGYDVNRGQLSLNPGFCYHG